MFKEIIISMRPKQWYKNLVLFAGILFFLNFFNIHMWITALFSFIIFCIVSGSEYIINNIMDNEADKIHIKNATFQQLQKKLNASYAFFLQLLCSVWHYGSIFNKYSFLRNLYNLFHFNRFILIILKVYCYCRCSYYFIGDQAQVLNLQTFNLAIFFTFILVCTINLFIKV